MTSVAFAGAGNITALHGLAAEALPDVQVTAVASRSAAKARERATQVGAKPCTYDELPCGADVVLVATPPALHASQTVHAIGRGARVILEKPLCTTLADADALVAADPDGTRIGYAENLAFAPIVRQALNGIGTIGPLHHLEARSLQERPSWGDFLTESWGGGVLFDLGVHPLALVLLAARPALPVSVRATLEGAPDVPVDVWAEVHLTFDSGLVARVETSWRSASPEWDLQAASADGVVRLELLPLLTLEIGGEPIAQPTFDAPIPQVHQYGYTQQLAELTAAARAGAVMPLGATFGRQVLDVVGAAYASAGQGGRPTALPFEGRRDQTPLELWRAHA